jgi:hypothetical protein
MAVGAEASLNSPTHARASADGTGFCSGIRDPHLIAFSILTAGENSLVGSAISEVLNASCL